AREIVAGESLSWVLYRRADLVGRISEEGMSVLDKFAERIIPYSSDIWRRPVREVDVDALRGRHAVGRYGSAEQRDARAPSHFRRPNFQGIVLTSTSLAEGAGGHFRHRPLMKVR